MIFIVTWTEAALQMLAAIWMAASNRNAVTVAAHEIDSLLRVDADTVGRVRYDTVREFKRPPLGVEFEVVEADRIVFVIGVWPIP